MPDADSLEGRPEDNSSCYIERDDVRVVVVKVRKGRSSDWKGGVKDWVVVDDDHDRADLDGRGRRDDPPMVNGIMT